LYDIISSENQQSQQPRLEAFFRRAGYEYISGIIPGGEFISTIEIISNDIETKEKIDAALSAQVSYSTVIPKMGAIDANAELKSKFAELAKYNNVRIEARCYRKGGVGAISTTPEEALEYAINFPASVQQSADILQVICKPYHELISFPDEFDTIAVERQQRVLRSLWDRYQQVTKSIADVDYILQYPMQFDGVEEGILRAGKQQLEQQLDEIADRAMNYAKNPTQIRVEGSDFATILLSLPPRKITPQPEPPLQTEDSIDAVALESAQGIDYRQLRDLLKAEKWQEADEETRKVMLKVVNRESEGSLNVDSVKQFPCQDLRTIDRLWVTASKGHFGFSVQKKIWQECGSPITYDNKDWTKFGDYIGWRKGGKWSDYQNLKFAGRFSPKGELPGVFVGTFWEKINVNVKEDIKSKLVNFTIFDPLGINRLTAGLVSAMTQNSFDLLEQNNGSIVIVLFSRVNTCEL
jgi:GUN4-like